MANIVFCLIVTCVLTNIFKASAVFEFVDL